MILAKCPKPNTVASIFPYVEDYPLRMPEPLTLLASACYGESLPSSSGGAPVRMVIPGNTVQIIKSLVQNPFQKKSLPLHVESLFIRAYGFYSNVIPQR